MLWNENYSMAQKNGRKMFFLFEILLFFGNMRLISSQKFGHAETGITSILNQLGYFAQNI